MDIAARDFVVHLLKRHLFELIKFRLHALSPLKLFEYHVTEKLKRESCVGQAGIKKGLKVLQTKYNKKDRETILKLRKYCKPFGDIVLDLAFANLWQRQVLDDREKEIAVLASLITQGCTLEEVKQHVTTALNRGLKIEEIKEIAVLMVAYIGIPRCLNALLAIREVEQKK